MTRTCIRKFYGNRRAEHQSPLVLRMTMHEVFNLLPKDQFVRVHQSYLLPMRDVKTIRDKKIILTGKEIPIGIRFGKQVMQLFQK